MCFTRLLSGAFPSWPRQKLSKPFRLSPHLTSSSAPSERRSSQPAEETASRPKRRSCQSPIHIIVSPVRTPFRRSLLKSQHRDQSTVHANRQFTSSSAPFPPRPNAVRRSLLKSQHRGQSAAQQPSRAAPSMPADNSHHRQRRSPPFFERHSSQPAEEPTSRPKRRPCQSPIHIIVSAVPRPSSNAVRHSLLKSQHRGQSAARANRQ